MIRGTRGGTQRKRPRFAAMVRRRSNLLFALPAAVLAAALLGVQLGRSAIAEINPIHFRGAEAPPRGFDPNSARPAPDAYASAYGWDQGAAARAEECSGDCDAHRARDAMAFALEPVRARPASAPYWRDATPTTEPAPWAPGQTGNGGLSVERYLHYPVEEASAEQAEAKVPPGEEEPVEDE